MQREGYAKTAEFEEEHWWFRSRRDLIIEQVKKAISNGDKQGKYDILDYGCGTGYNLHHLEKFGSVTGADINTGSIEEFSKIDKYPYIDLNNDLTQYYGKYNLILALDVIEHVDDDVQILKEIRKLLSPKGELIITVPAYECLWSGEDVISLHKRRYTITRLLTAVGEAGYIELFSSYFNLGILPLMATVIWGKKVLFPKKANTSNLSKTNRFFNWILYQFTHIEGKLVGTEILSLPAGSSIICRLVNSPK
jgi:2-polyprenyl-3-methyl-5-hydroxy-6-metoxy-1,4-benzoquinol methylase